MNMNQNLIILVGTLIIVGGNGVWAAKSTIDIY